MKRPAMTRAQKVYQMHQRAVYALRRAAMRYAMTLDTGRDAGEARDALCIAASTYAGTLTPREGRKLVGADFAKSMKPTPLPAPVPTEIVVTPSGRDGAMVQVLTPATPVASSTIDATVLAVLRDNGEGWLTRGQLRGQTSLTAWQVRSALMRLVRDGLATRTEHDDTSEPRYQLANVVRVDSKGEQDSATDALAAMLPGGKRKRTAAQKLNAKLGKAIFGASPYKEDK